MRYRKVGNTFIIRLVKGEEIINSLTKLLKKEKIYAAHFSGIGAVQSATLGFYNLKKKKYLWKRVGECEVASLTGNAVLFSWRAFERSHSWSNAGNYVREIARESKTGI